jgi:hypothetical protein
MIVLLMLFENRNFCAQCLNSYKLLERDKFLKVLHSIGIQISYIVLMFQNFWSYISMVFVQIITDCSVLDRFCFLLHSVLILMMLWIISGGISHGEVRI